TRGAGPLRVKTIAKPVAAPAATTPPTIVQTHHFLYAGLCSAGGGAAAMRTVAAGVATAGVTVAGGGGSACFADAARARSSSASISFCSCAIVSFTDSRFGALSALFRYARYSRTASRLWPSCRSHCAMLNKNDGSSYLRYASRNESSAC